MSEKERYATIGTWERVFREEGVSAGRVAMARRIEGVGLIGKTARNRAGQVIREGYYAESDVRQACFDLLNPLDTAYFKNPDNIRTDLDTFVAQLGEGRTYMDLNTHNIHFLCITCQSGQVIKGTRYLYTAAKALGFAKSHRESLAKQAQTLKHLLRTAGFDIFDEDYFRNSEKIEFDLRAFASQLGEGKTPLDLNTANTPLISITCKNGQVMRGASYLSTAAIVLGFAKNNKEASSKKARILKYLLRTAGFEVPEYSPLDRAYFQDPAIVRADLTAFASQLGEGKAPLDLTTQNITSLSITCQNNRVMRGQAYINTAAKALGFAKNYKEAGSKQAKVIKQLLKTAGFDIFDKAYFLDPNKVSADLTAFASQLGHNKGSLDFSAGSIRKLIIICQNGQAMRGVTYLHTAARALGFAKTTKEASRKHVHTLRILKEIAGYLTNSDD